MPGQSKTAKVPNVQKISHNFTSQHPPSIWMTQQTETPMYRFQIKMDTVQTYLFLAWVLQSMIFSDPIRLTHVSHQAAIVWSLVTLINKSQPQNSKKDFIIQCCAIYLKELSCSSGRNTSPSNNKRNIRSVT